MGKIVSIDLHPDVAATYERLAREQHRTLEYELIALIEGHVARPYKDTAALLRLSDEALAMTPPDGPNQESLVSLSSIAPPDL